MISQLMAVKILTDKKKRYRAQRDQKVSSYKLQIPAYQT